MERSVVGVVGAGTMGAGIAQLALESGHEVVLHDVDEAAIERGRARIREGLARRAARLELDADSIDDWVAGRLAGLRDAAHARRRRRGGRGRDRGGARGPRPQAGDLPRARRRQRAGGHARDEHQRVVGGSDRRSDASDPSESSGCTSSTRRRSCRWWRSCAAERTDPSIVDRGGCAHVGVGEDARSLRRFAGLHRQPGQSPIHARGAAHARGGRRHRSRRSMARSAKRGFPLGPFELIDLAGVDVNLAADPGNLGGPRVGRSGCGRPRCRSGWSAKAASVARPAAGSTGMTLRDAVRSSPNSWADRQRSARRRSATGS